MPPSTVACSRAGCRERRPIDGALAVITAVAVAISAAVDAGLVRVPPAVSPDAVASVPIRASAGHTPREALLDRLAFGTVADVLRGPEAAPTAASPGERQVNQPAEPGRRPCLASISIRGDGRGAVAATHMWQAWLLAPGVRGTAERVGSGMPTEGGRLGTAPHR